MKCRECQASRGRGCSASKRPSWGKETRTRDDTFTKMAKREGPSTSRPRTRSKAAEERREAKEAESTQGLDKLPQEVWEKILLDHLDENDLFPLALSCRFFRQKQKELVARTRHDGPGSDERRRTLKTNLWRKLDECQPASADYLRFCSEEKLPEGIDRLVTARARDISCLAAFHGHLPLLQEDPNKLREEEYNYTTTGQPYRLGATIIWAAGESSSSS